MDDAEEFKIAIEGPGVSPETVDAELFLAIAHEYLHALKKTAKDNGSEFDAVGIKIKDGSVIAAIGTSNASNAKSSAIILNDELASPHLYTRHKRLRSTIKRVPAECSISVSHGVWRQVVPSYSEVEAYRTLTTMRVVVEKIGSVKEPSIWVRNIFNDKRLIHVKVQTYQVAKDISPHLYDQIEIRAEFLANSDHRIVGGELITWEPMDPEEGTPLEAWSKWFAPHAKIWNAMSDEEIRAELGDNE